VVTQRIVSARAGIREEKISVSSGRKLKLLVVDDEPSICDCIRLLLSHDGHDVEVANSAGAALSVFAKDKFDLIFTDYSMPGMKGDELAERIKAVAPNQPVMMISGFAPERDALRSVDFVLSKPFDLGDLREAVSRFSQIEPETIGD
jgi:CheY-like chemotaxis protein